MADLGTAYVQIVPSAQGIKGKITKELSGEVDQAGDEGGKSLGRRLIGGLAKAGIVTAVGSQLKQAFEAGGALQQSFGGLETIYGEAADQAKEFAMQAASAGISANTYAEQAVSFGAALKKAYGGDTTAAMEAANMAIMDMADNAAKMGTPIESLQSAYQGFAKQNYTMLDNLKLGYGGTQEDMEHLLKDAQKISGMEYNIDNLGDVYDAIHVIQGELGLTGVAAGEAETTLTGSMGAVKASWENVMAALTTGEGLDTALNNMVSSFGAFSHNVLTMLANIAPQLPELIVGLADVIIDNAPVFLSAGLELMAKLLFGLITSLPTIIAEMPNIIGGIVNAFYEVDWAQLGKDIINGIIKGLVAWKDRLWSQIKSLVTGGLKAGQDAAQTGSPSRLFANELGRWIPAGIALGVDQNAYTVNTAVRDAIAGATRQPLPSPMARSTGGSDADRIIAALQGLRLVTEVELSGDARKIFRVVRTENTTQTRRTNYNALAAAGV
ncbi:MAG: hypothetical protein IKE76_02940 [Clostridia bacterium]|nr:hypothetical protein [Clostridia bacterium]